ncbi:MAG: hypothetical protein DLM57_06990 [Pseudonocardiales bacterium]|nr:MAG: hypothetical protein DLM57_06990 [Pseudonocardiales bacterium]
MLKAKCTHGALVIVRNSDDEYLLVRQRLRERNRWSFPGGFLNPSEDPIDGAVRELREEAGLDLPTQRLELLDQYRQSWLRFFGHFDHVYVASVGTAELRPKRSIEIRACGWFAADRLPELTASTHEALRRLRHKEREAARLDSAAGSLRSGDKKLASEVAST